MTFDGIGVNDVIRILRDETFIIRLDAGYIFFLGGGGGGWMGVRNIWRSTGGGGGSEINLGAGGS